MTFVMRHHEDNHHLKGIFVALLLETQMRSRKSLLPDTNRYVGRDLEMIL